MVAGPEIARAITEFDTNCMMSSKRGSQQERHHEHTLSTQTSFATDMNTLVKTIDSYRNSFDSRLQNISKHLRHGEDRATSTQRIHRRTSDTSNQIRSCTHHGIISHYLEAGQWRTLKDPCHLFHFSKVIAHSSRACLSNARREMEIWRTFSNTRTISILTAAIWRSPFRYQSWHRELRHTHPAQLVLYTKVDAHHDKCKVAMVVARAKSKLTTLATTDMPWRHYTLHSATKS